MSFRFSWKRRSSLLLTLGTCLANFGALQAEEFVVKLKTDHPSFGDAVGQFAEKNQVKIIDRHDTGKILLIDLHDLLDHTLAEQLATIAREELVDYIVPNIKMHAFETPNDPQLPSQWSLGKIKAAEAWNLTKGHRDVVVAVIDTGIDWQHEDLKANIWQNSAEIADNGIDDDNNGYVDDVRGWDFHGNDNNPTDETSAQNPGHGTHCAGIVGAVGDNGTGISGIAQQVSLMPIRFLGADGSGDLMAAAKAIDYAIAAKAQVISASWGAAVPRSGVAPILEAIGRANEKGIIFVAAAANDGKSNDTREVYPANAGLPNVISVAASDPQDQKPSWSNFGRAKVDLASPGLDIFSSVPGGKYQNLSGTSMATPLVAGTVALALSQARLSGKELKPTEVKAILQATGAKVGIETACHCRIDALAALVSIENDALTLVPNAATLAAGATVQFDGLGGTAPYTFTSSKPEVATMGADGKLTAKADGETVLTITDANGSKAESRTIYVGLPQGGGTPGECPFGPLCDALCQINPQLPWCS